MKEIPVPINARDSRCGKNGRINGLYPLLASLRPICDQSSAEYRANGSPTVQQETRRTNKLTFLDYLDTVEVIGSIPVAPILSGLNRLHLGVWLRAVRDVDGEAGVSRRLDNGHAGSRDPE